MIQIQFKKLIRHKVVQRIYKEEVLINEKNLSNKEFIYELHKKLFEISKNIMIAQEEGDIKTLKIELAEILEVINTISDENEILMEELENIRLEQRDINGYFSSENYINDITVSENNYKLIDYLKDKKKSYKLEN